MRPLAIPLLIALNVIAYLWERAVGDRAELLFALWPLQPLAGQHLFHAWQLVSYAFLHDPLEIGHILFNMVGLWMFGGEVERQVGPRWVLACYLASVITAALSQLFVPALLGAAAGPTIGASGGVFGLLLGYAWLFPRRKVIALLLPIPMPAWLFATLYAGVELFLGVTRSQASVAHFAHLGGMIGGGFVIWQWRLRYRR